MFIIKYIHFFIYTLLHLPHDVLTSVLNDWFMTSCCIGCGVGLPSFPVSPIHNLLISLIMSSYSSSTTTCCLYCCTESRSIFPVQNGGSGWNFWELATGERGQLEVKDEKENMPLVDNIYSRDCRWVMARFASCTEDFGRRQWRHESSVVTKYI